MDLKSIRRVFITGIMKMHRCNTEVREGNAVTIPRGKIEAVDYKIDFFEIVEYVIVCE